jgi:hypothetical protein
VFDAEGVTERSGDLRMITHAGIEYLRMHRSKSFIAEPMEV